MESTNPVVPKRNWKKLFNVGAITAAGTAMATSAFAQDSSVDQLWAAADVSNLEAKVVVVLLAFVGIGLMLKSTGILRRLGLSA